MPLPVPALDDRGYADLVEELLARIPAHTPEWTHPRLGDPGAAMYLHVAWMIDTLLYRANLIPERQRLVFLRLLGVPLRAARAARGMVTVHLDNPAEPVTASLAPFATLRGPVPCETRNELTVLPVEVQVYVKRRLGADDGQDASVLALVEGLRSLHNLQRAEPYVTTPLFPNEVPTPAGVDLITEAVDRTLWLGLFAPRPLAPDAVRALLGTTGTGARRLLNVGFAPATEVPGVDERASQPVRIPLRWESCWVDGDQTRFLPLDVVQDGTDEFTRDGVVRVALPPAEFLTVPANDPRRRLDAGVGELPPRIDTPELGDRLVGWLRVRPRSRVTQWRVGWAAGNAVEVDQRRTLGAVVAGTSNGSPNQRIALPISSLEADSVVLEVAEPGQPPEEWRRSDDLAVEGRDAHAFELDAEAGTISFGDGVRGAVPAAGARIRLTRARQGGGAAGNLPPMALTSLTALDLSGQPIVERLKVIQQLPMRHGADAETLAEGEARIGAWLRHRNRAVTAEDFRSLAAEAAPLGRVELLPRFKPQQRLTNVAGVVSVMVFPRRDDPLPPYPRADRPTIEAVHRHLDARRPLGTELYVIGCAYVPLGIGVGVTIRDGFGRDDVLHRVRDALRLFVWSLPPGGPDEGGWPLGRPVRERELEVVVARVQGVREVVGVRLFEARNDDWRAITGGADGAALSLQVWELPELLSVVVNEGAAPADLTALPNPFGDEPAVPVPIVPEVC